MKQQRSSRGAVRQLKVGRSTRKRVQVPKFNPKPILMWAGRLLLLAGISSASYLLWPHLNQPVVEVEFTGELARVDRNELRQRVEETVDSGLLTLDIKTLDAAVENIDWVFAAEIQKSWPSRLSIEIREERPVARWGEVGYLAESGVMVRSPSFEDLVELPSFDVQVTEPHNALDLFYGLNSAMLTTGIGIQELRQSQFGSWSMVMENGSEIVLGKDDLMIRMRRVIQAWQRLTPDHINELEAIDARYPNGVAVKYSQQQVVHDPQQVNGDWKT